MNDPSDAPVRFVIFHRPGPGWTAELPFWKQPGVNEHVAHYARALHAGHLERGGPFLDESGGMMVFAPTVDLANATAIIEADPALQSGMLVAEVKPWMAALAH